VRVRLQGTGRRATGPRRIGWRIGWPVVRPGATWAVAFVGCLALVATVVLAPAASAGAPTAVHISGVPFAGALFPHGTRSTHTCSATVVRTAGRDVVLTAAHCLSGSGRGLVFVPGYRRGAEPAGEWTVTAAYADPRWVRSRDPQHDYAFLVVAPRRQGDRVLRLEDVVTGVPVGVAPASGTSVRIVAYPEGRKDLPISCTHPTYRHAGYPAFDCHGYVGGTSGAGWLTGAPGHEVVRGVVGGLHHGGCTEFTSYSPRFDGDTLLALGRAGRGATADVLPRAGGDGC